MKIYTRVGDGGTTALIGGSRVSKDDARVEAYGTLDELMAFVGLLMSYPESVGYRAELEGIQRSLMVCSSLAAVDDVALLTTGRVPALEEARVSELEAAVDRLLLGLPELRYFVLPGGSSPSVALTHVARTVARRAERRLVVLEGLPAVVLSYVNRLSDYFFALGRRMSFEQGDSQTIWIP